MSIPNCLTSYRILITPIAVLLLLLGWPESRMWVAALTTTAWLSDMLDGILARMLGLSSELGSSLDLVADKLYVLSVLIALSSLELAPAWIVITIVARELLVAQLRYYSAIKGVVKKVSILGKFKLGASMVAIIALCIGMPWGKWLLYLALVLTITSGLEYLVAFVRHIREALSSN